MKRLKVFVVSSFGDNSYANWINCSFVNNISDADLVLGVGGADVSPHYYNEPNSGLLYCSPNTDRFEYGCFMTAIKLGKKILGICKSAQWGAALAGGKIYQDINHPGRHDVTTFDGKTLPFNSLHHNMANLSSLKENDDYKLLAWAESLSSFHIDGYGVNHECAKEPEVVFYPKINFLGFQNHNEMIYGLPQFDETIAWSREILQKFIENKL